MPTNTTTRQNSKRQEKCPEPAHNLEAERGILGGILLENQHITEVVDMLGADQFYLPAHRHVYRAILQLYRAGIGFDPVTVGDALKQQNELHEVGGYDYLNELLESVPHAAHTKHYAGLIVDCHVSRTIEMGASDLMRAARVGSTSTDDLTGMLESLAGSIRALRGKGPTGLDIVNLADVESKQVAWHWPGRFPLAMFSLLVGEPGAGKTQFVCDMVADTTNGARWPDGSGYARQGEVLWLCTEDALEYTMRPRLDAAGADPKLVSFVRGVLNVKKESGKPSNRALRLDLDVPRLEKYLADHPATVMIVADPVTEILGAIDAHKNEQVRGVLAPLCTAAEKFNVMVLGLSHFNKGLGQRALAKIMGSLAFVAVARAVWAIVPDGDDDERRLLLPVKMNIAKRPEGMAFRITDCGVVWETDPVRTSVDDALKCLADSGNNGEGRKLDTAKDWLKQRLADGQEIESDKLLAEAKAAGISQATHLRSKKELKDECGLRSEKEAGVKNGRWFVSIPIQPAHFEHLEKLNTLSPLGPFKTEDAQDAQHTQHTQLSQDTHSSNAGDWTEILKGGRPV